MKSQGKFKDECNGAVIAEFIGLRSKMYSILKVGDETTNPKHGIRKAKGVPSKVVKKEFHTSGIIKHSSILSIMIQFTFRAIRSDRHAINVIEMSKVGLSLWMIKNGLHKIISQCMRMGDYRIPQLEN
ncbi:unnamed protein product [Rhizophagus irregularis]|nr:unnamed protein product [Rhizophagus irregularis]